MAIHKFKEQIRSNYGVFSSALGSETSDFIQTATFISAKNYDIIAGVAQASGASSNDVVTLQMYQASNATGGGSKVVTGATDTYTSTSTSGLGTLVSQVRGADLDYASGFYYVGLRLTTSDGTGTEKVAGMLLQVRARYKQATLPA